ncbi:MAG TPA: ABC transporter ATP-binding protein [Thermoleophilia bacterium]|nr:ABC transporter ATP-binding protein [Thermoleophilia bacterium]
MIGLLKERLTPYWRQIALVIALLFVQAGTNLYLPTLNADLINNGIVKADTHYIVVTGAFMLAVTLILVIATIVAVYWGSKTAMAFGRDVRGLLFRKVESFSQAELNHFGTPSLITRTTNDVQQVQMLVLMMLNLTLAAPIMAIGGIIMALRLDVPLSSVILVAVPVMGVFIGLVVTRALPLFRSMQKKIDRVNQVTREVLSGVRVIRAFDRVGYEEQRFDAANTDLTGTTLSVMRLFALVMPALMLIMNLATVAIVWFGSVQVADHGMPIGDLTAFMTYILLILMSVLMATFMLIMVPRASASAERIQQVLHADVSVTDPGTPVVDAPVRGHVEFRDVEFRYPGAQDPVLSHISFTSGPGEVTAIVGSTGSGKSTLINLIPRFYDVTGGSVVVDGVDVREMALQDLWHRIGLVPQKAFLFSGTVADNLRYGDEAASDAELWHFLETAQGTEFVSEMPEGIEALVDQGGANVSGGQRQRLAIARALAKKARIQIFDDSFSALDFTTDARLRAALKQETTDSTVIIVAQRVGTVMHADQIIVLEDGTIAGKGTHEELLKTSATYREIVESQLGAEGVA